jgi:hypothetical protein
MARIYVFADESGNMDFSRGKSATRYFLITTITSIDCQVGHDLLELRREMAWRREGLSEDFHACENTQLVRDRVFGVLREAQFIADVTVYDKPKVPLYYRQQQPYFYHFAWYRHIRRIAPMVAQRGDELLVVSAAIGTKQTRKQFHRAVSEPISWLLPSVSSRTAHWSTSTDPCLVAADYVAWAVQRKWERQDDRSYQLIAGKLRSEEDEFATSTETYY